MERTENTPFVNFSLQCLKDNCLKFNRLFPNSKILYSIKANAEDRIIDTVDKMGFGFDVASLGEIYIMKRHKIDSDRIYFSNPTKIPKHISHAKSEGINRFAFDSKMEVEKLSKLAPKSEVYVRIIVNNDGSRWPLKSKFGVDLNEALSLMHYAREMGLLPKGITFHVGSQNLSPKTWTLAIQKSAHLWKMLIREKLMTKDSFINMGGGFPGTYKEKTPPLQQYAKQINSDFSKLFPTETQMIIEPGRSLVADCGYIESTIIN
ncbi:type III PLP-dependent enzyme, partial [Candidatus Dojkabacteria bacterium]|nr:type III PLP-dependent enzyme [Candidatus Dojkabacteria bacterium]